MIRYQNDSPPSVRILLCEEHQADYRKAGFLALSGEVEKAMSSARSRGFRAAEFTGRHVLSLSHADSILELALDQEFEEIGVRTNGIGRKADELSETIIAHDRFYIDVPFLTFRAERFDALVSPKSVDFTQQIKGFQHVLRLGGRLRLRLVINELNQNYLSDLADLIASELNGIERILLSAGHQFSTSSPFAFRPQLEGALEKLMFAGVPARISPTGSIPHCFFDGYPERSAWIYDGPSLSPSAQKRSPVSDPRCSNCAVSDRCAGFPLADMKAEVQPNPFAQVPETIRHKRDEPKAAKTRPRKVGRLNRLRDFTTFSDYMKHSWDSSDWGEREPPTVYISVEEYEKLNFNGEGTPGVVLVRSPCLNTSLDVDFFALPPMSIMLLGSLLKKHNYPVRLHDLAVDIQRTDLTNEEERSALWDHKRLLSVLEGATDETIEPVIERVAQGLDPQDGQLFGFSIEAPEDVTFALLLVKALKSRANIRVVFGGRIQSKVGEILDRHRYLDWVVRGEGDLPLLMLAASMHGAWKTSQIPNLITRHRGRIRENPYAFHDLNIFVTPEPFELDPKAYQMESCLSGVHLYPYLFVKGCPFTCGYCGGHSDRTFRVRDAERVGEDLERLSKQFGVKRFYFLNTLLNVTRSVADELLRDLEKRDLEIEWTDCARAVNIDEQTFVRLRKVGCVHLTWGIDAGSARLQRIMRTGLHLGKSVSVLRAAKRAGIRNTVNLIAGLPHETDEDRRETLRFLHEIEPLCDRIEVHRFKYFKTTPVYLEPERFDLIRCGRGFDEIGGLKWDEKEKSIFASHDMFKREFAHKTFFSEFSDRK